MTRVPFLFFVLLTLSFGQSRSRLDDYALILSDAPVAQNTHSRAELRGAAAQGALTGIRTTQNRIVAELKRRHVTVTGAAQVLANAIFVSATADTARTLHAIPGVAHVVYLPKVKPDLTTALTLENVQTAWASIGGDTNAGAGIKIGIVDSGIDQNHPGFQDASLKPPSGFPKGDSTYTNNKVIVARSYINLTVAAWNTPDDTSARDHLGHGTAIAMIAAGVKNTGPQGTIEGVAPKAFLGSYKVFGSPGVDDAASYVAVQQAMEDALSDGMDIVTLSLNEGSPVQYGPLDIDQSNCGGACDIYAQAVENAVKQGMVVVASAGNDGNAGTQPATLGSIHTPGAAPSAITVGASTNAHVLYQAVHVNGSAVPSSLQNIHAIFGDGPHIASPLTAKVVDAGLACSNLAAGSLAGAIALIQRGTCFFSDKVNYAQTAGAVGVILYQTAGVDTILGTYFGVQNTGIPTLLIGNTDGTALKSYIAANSGLTVSLDPALTAVSAPGYTVAPYSSRGPTPGLSGITPTLVIKPELVAVGDSIYTAAQKYDPSGDVYHASGYASVSGTSYAVPMVAGAVALVKQKFPNLTPAQLKSAVVNTATQNVTDAGGQAKVNSVGAGQLSASDALNAAATLEPATLSFGSVATSSALPIRLTLKVTNIATAAATFSFADSASNVQIAPTTLVLAPGQSNSVTVTLASRQTAPGSYEGFVNVTGSGPTLRVPYQYLVPSGIANDIYPIQNGGFVGAPGDTEWYLGFRVIDSVGLPVSTSVRFSTVTGGGKVVAADTVPDRLGDAFADVTLGTTVGDQTFTATAGGLTVTFNGYARRLPVVAANGVVNAASNLPGQGLAPGSYIAIYGSSLADATLTAYTPSLPVSLAEVTVGFTGAGLSLPAHIYFVSPTQIDVQIPWEFQGQSSVQMTVMANYLSSATYTVPLATYSPAIFVAGGNAAVLDQNYGLVTAANPAKRGQVIQIFANGLGPVGSAQVTGDPASSTQLVNTTATPTVTVGGVNAPVAFSGLAPGNIGLYQVNVTVPSNAPTGTQPLVISIGGVASPSANLPVQ